jgi:hypothetical protein
MSSVFQYAGKDIISIPYSVRPDKGFENLVERLRSSDQSCADLLLPGEPVLVLAEVPYSTNQKTIIPQGYFKELRALFHDTPLVGVSKLTIHAKIWTPNDAKDVLKLADIIHYVQRNGTFEFHQAKHLNPQQLKDLAPDNDDWK